MGPAQTPASRRSGPEPFGAEDVYTSKVVAIKPMPKARAVNVATKLAHRPGYWRARASGLDPGHPGTDVLGRPTQIQLTVLVRGPS